MNDRHDDGYDPDAYQLLGYDEYGRPVYGHPGAAPQQTAYDPYGQPRQPQQGYGYDPYAAQQQTPYDPYGQQQYEQQQPYGYEDPYGTGRQPPVQQAEQAPVQQPQQTQQWIPQRHQPDPEAARAPEPVPEQPVTPPVPEQRRPVPAEGTATGTGYRTAQFSFIEDPSEDAEDVIDWLKFTESRTERREEARRQGRNRVVALVAVLALTLTGGVGYLWYAGKLPGLSSDSERATAASTTAQKRDVIVVHLHDTKNGGTSTALLVDNVTTKQGTTVLLPDSLAVSTEDGSATTLGTSVDDEGSAATRDSLDTLLGTKIGGTWRLDTPYLDNLVELVGGVDIDTNATVPAAKKGESPLVKKGENQTLGGPATVAYATYQASGESETEQLKRFGQIMEAVLKKVSENAADATATVQALAQIPDPSLSEKDLGASLAKLAEHAKIGDYRTTVLPVQSDGTLSEQATDSVVKDILGGTVTAPEADAAVRVGVKNASGEKDNSGDARVVLVNGGYTFVDGGTAAAARAASVVTYTDAARKADAEEVAKTLGLPTSAVKKGETANNADVSVVLGQDYEPSSQSAD